MAKPLAVPKKTVSARLTLADIRRVRFWADVEKIAVSDFVAQAVEEAVARRKAWAKETPSSEMIIPGQPTNRSFCSD